MFVKVLIETKLTISFNNESKIINKKKNPDMFNTIFIEMLTLKSYLSPREVTMQTVINATLLRLMVLPHSLVNLHCVNNSVHFVKDITIYTQTYIDKYKNTHICIQSNKSMLVSFIFKIWLACFIIFNFYCFNFILFERINMFIAYPVVSIL